MLGRWLLTMLVLLPVGCGGKPAVVRRDEPVQVLEEIEAWIKVNAPPLAEVWNPPATEEAIAAFEAQYRVTLPPAVRAMYRRHNGESKKSDGVFGCIRWMPLEEAGAATELTGEGRIPLLVTGGGDMHYVKSYNPAAPDEKLYDWWHEDPEQAAVIAPSVLDFLEAFRLRMLRGQYVFKPRELMALIDVRDLR